jgi:hypothetical protein
MDLTPVVRDRAEMRLRNRFMRPLLTIVVKPGLSIAAEFRQSFQGFYSLSDPLPNGDGRPADAGRPSWRRMTGVYL